jgi:hypothetical protein
MWGNPAVPNINDIPKEIASKGSQTCLPGANTPGYLAAALLKSAIGLKPNFASTKIANKTVPPSNRIVHVF